MVTMRASWLLVLALGGQLGPMAGLLNVERSTANGRDGPKYEYCYHLPWWIGLPVGRCCQVEVAVLKALQYCEGWGMEMRATGLQGASCRVTRCVREALAACLVLCLWQGLVGKASGLRYGDLCRRTTWGVARLQLGAMFVYNIFLVDAWPLLHPTDVRLGRYKRVGCEVALGTCRRHGVYHRIL